MKLLSAALPLPFRLQPPPPPSAAAMSKRRRVNPPPSSTPPPPAMTPSSKHDPNPNRNPRRSLSGSLLPSSDSGDSWELLPLLRSDFSLPLTFPTGQTFRWRRTGEGRFTGVVGPHLLSLAHLDGDPDGRVVFHIHNAASSSVTVARSALADYLNLGISLADLWAGFSAADHRFAELAARLGGGARVLRQDPLECVLQFLCSSNNNIGRIEKMVGVLSGYGRYLGSVGEFDFHEFPSLERLALVSEKELREAGFGYRAKYIIGTVKALLAKPSGGATWLASLRESDLTGIIDALCTLPGVGPKVAACIALFSLDQHHAIPVDTHVWQIATRYLTPELAGMSLSPKLHNRVSEAFVAKFGKYAGWAQNVLFIGELSPQKVLPPLAGTTKDTGSSKAKHTKKNLPVKELKDCG